jgi:hypothetical protein
MLIYLENSTIPIPMKFTGNSGKRTRPFSLFVNISMMIQRWIDQTQEFIGGGVV